MITTLNDFLLSLIPLGAHAVLIVDEAQNLPLSILEQIRILSNLETDKEKLLQIILVGQLNLVPLLRSPELRQLDQRVSIRYQLKPLTDEETGAYVAHRLAIANPSRSVVFTSAALKVVYEVLGRHSPPDQHAVRSRTARGILGADDAHRRAAGKGRRRRTRSHVAGKTVVAQPVPPRHAVMRPT